MNDYPLGSIQRAILKRAATAPVTVKALAEDIGTCTPSVAHALKGLERRGLIKRPTGWRATGHGKAKAAELPAA